MTIPPTPEYLLRCDLVPPGRPAVVDEGRPRPPLVLEAQDGRDDGLPDGRRVRVAGDVRAVGVGEGVVAAAGLIKN